MHMLILFDMFLLQQAQTFSCSSTSLHARAKLERLSCCNTKAVYRIAQLTQHWFNEKTGKWVAIPGGVCATPLWNSLFVRKGC
jgi:hypothetical protein